MTPPSSTLYLTIHTNGYREAPRIPPKSTREGIIGAVIPLLFNQLRRNKKTRAELDYANEGGFRTRLRGAGASGQLCHVIHFFCKLFILLSHHLAQLGTVGTTAHTTGATEAATFLEACSDRMDLRSIEDYSITVF